MAAPTTTTLQATWSAPTTGVNGPLTYQVAYRVHGAATWTLSGSPVAGSPYTITGLTANTPYDIQVTPIDQYGNAGTAKMVGPWYTAQTDLPFPQSGESAAGTVVTSSPGTITDALGNTYALALTSGSLDGGVLVNGVRDVLIPAPFFKLAYVNRKLVASGGTTTPYSYVRNSPTSSWVLTATAGTVAPYSIDPVPAGAGFASWIPPSPGRGLPRVGIGLFTVNNGDPTYETYTAWAAQTGLTVKLTNGYTGFTDSASTLSNAYYCTHGINASGFYTTVGSGVIPVVGCSLEIQDGSVTLNNIPTGATDTFWKKLVDNLMSGGPYPEIWLRINYEANIQTVPGGYNGGRSGWAALFKAAFQYVSNLITTYMAATYPTRVIRIGFDTTPLNSISYTTNFNNNLSAYKPDPQYYDFASFDLYTGNFFPKTYSRWKGFWGEVPFTRNWAAVTTTSTDVNLWATDGNPSAAQGNQGYSYDNAAHWYCFQDAIDSQPNGGSGQALDTLIAMCLADKKPMMHGEWGGLCIAQPGGTGPIQQGNGAGYMVTNLYAAFSNHYRDINDLNYYAYCKRMWAAIEDRGVPVLGAIVWDQPSFTNISGPDAPSGGVTPGMRATLRHFAPAV